MKRTRTLPSSLRLFGWYFFLLFLSAQSVGQEAEFSYGSISASRVIRVIDGDTFVVDIDQFPDLIGKGISVRVNGIDTPEILRGNCEREKELGIKAKERVEALLNSSETIVLENLSRGSFFRIVADVIVDGVDLGQLILNEGLAMPYRSGRESPWCV